MTDSRRLATLRHHGARLWVSRLGLVSLPFEFALGLPERERPVLVRESHRYQDSVSKSPSTQGSNRVDALSFSTEGSRRNTSVGSEGLTDKIGPLAKAKAVYALRVRFRLEAPSPSPSGTV